jgi:pimeloyl-ACP methyl ester carboxylesterase
MSGSAAQEGYSIGERRMAGRRATQFCQHNMQEIDIKAERNGQGGRGLLRASRAEVCRLIDRVVIRFATARMPGPRGIDPHFAEADQLLKRPDFFQVDADPAVLQFQEKNDFQFLSCMATPYAGNNTAWGCVHYCDPDWKSKPAVILLHGWNDSLTYRLRFPWLARRFNRLGFNCATLALPYHFQRRPEPPGLIRNFISEDALRTLEAVRQGVADIRGLAGWLLKAGCPKVGVLGVSLGGWLGGLAACTDRNIDFAVLFTPVARLDRLVDELGFVEPLRRSLRDQTMDLSKLNLVSHRPLTQKSNILLVEAEDDLFIPKDTMEELWRSWGEPDMWRLAHGHISVLASNHFMNKAAQWIARKTAAPDLS